MRSIARISAPIVAAVLTGFAALGATPASAAMNNPAELVVTGQVRPDVFGTVTLPTRFDKFSVRWSNATRDESSSPAVQKLVAPARNLDAQAQLSYVQSTVNRLITWRSDATQYGEQDYWARADQTLASRLGDNEDFATVKMQALKALGFRSSDMYLTWGKDSVTGPDHAVLLVRTGGKFWVLDDSGDQPVTTEQRAGFTPIMTLGANGSYLHGRRFAAAATAHGQN
jgi:predicted transglutaminase-like cysteine proteinase